MQDEITSSLSQTRCCAVWVFSLFVTGGWSGWSFFHNSATVASCGKRANYYRVFTDTHNYNWSLPFPDGHSSGKKCIKLKFQKRQRSGLIYRYWFVNTSVNALRVRITTRNLLGLLILRLIFSYILVNIKYSGGWET